MSRRILFVCTGNTCRSPMAEALARSLFPEDAFSSAGVRAQAGQPAASHAITVLSERSIDLSGHRSQQVTAHLLQASDWVLCMSASHREILLEEFPQVSDKVRILREFVDLNPRDVADPFGGSLTDYQRCLSQLEEAISLLAAAPRPQ